jgi:ParB-like chromosome segregation protein Spo0J
MLKQLNYALDLVSPARFVVTELEGAAGAALSAKDLARKYNHGLGADLYRVRENENMLGDFDASVWILVRAAQEIKGVSVKDEDLISLDSGMSIDKLRFRGDRIAPIIDVHKQLRDPFDPNSGVFANNIRKFVKTDNVELRQSMEQFGWLEEFPAIRDERGVVLVGHRRIAVAKELGIEPVIKDVRLGFNDAADAKRFGLAIASNIGAKAFSADDRKRIAEYLYSEHEWTMEKIGKALSVSKMTISKDLESCKPTLQPPRPKGGRPKKVRDVKADNPNRERDKSIFEMHDNGTAIKEIAAEIGTHKRNVTRIVKEEKLWHEGYDKGRQEAMQERCRCPNCGHSFDQ